VTYQTDANGQPVNQILVEAATDIDKENIGRRFNQDLVNRLAVRICLIGHQTFAQPVLGKWYYSA
jgi:hypothetical protein